MQRRTLLSSLILSVFSGVALFGVSVFRRSAQAQMQNPEELQSNPAMPATRVPLGYKRGLDELRAVLDASEPAHVPSVRRVVILLPPNYSEFRRSQEAAMTAIREYFLIADQRSLTASDSNKPVVPDLESEGVAASLPNGGTIRLRIRRINESDCGQAIGELQISNHKIPGFEQVNQIEFIVQ